MLQLILNKLWCAATEGRSAENRTVAEQFGHLPGLAPDADITGNIASGRLRGQMFMLW